MTRIDPKQYAFELAREILGKSAGGLVTKLAQHCKTDWWHVISLLMKAENAAEPREYIGGVLANQISEDREWWQKGLNSYAGVTWKPKTRRNRPAR